MPKLLFWIVLGELLIGLGAFLAWGWPPALIVAGISVALDAVWTARDQHYQEARARYEQDRGENDAAFLSAQAQLRRRL